MRWAEEALENAIRDLLINIEFYQQYYPRTEDLDPFIQEACDAVYEIIGYKKCKEEKKNENHRKEN